MNLLVAEQERSEAGLGGKVNHHLVSAVPHGGQVLAALDGPWVMNQRRSLGDRQAPPGLPQQLLSPVQPGHLPALVSPGFPGGGVYPLS